MVVRFIVEKHQRWILPLASFLAVQLASKEEACMIDRIRIVTTDTVSSTTTQQVMPVWVTMCIQKSINHSQSVVHSMTNTVGFHILHPIPIRTAGFHMHLTSISKQQLGIIHGATIHLLHVPHSILHLRKHRSLVLLHTPFAASLDRRLFHPQILSLSLQTMLQSQMHPHQNQS